MGMNGKYRYFNSLQRSFFLEYMIIWVIQVIINPFVFCISISFSICTTALASIGFVFEGGRDEARKCLHLTNKNLTTSYDRMYVFMSDCQCTCCCN